jgi:hypothetical protein
MKQQTDMSSRFQLPVTYNGEEQEYSTELVSFGYTYKFNVHVNGNDLTFETDDEGCFRVIGEKDAKVDPELLQSIIESLQYLTRK